MLSTLNVDQTFCQTRSNCCEVGNVGEEHGDLSKRLNLIEILLNALKSS